MDLIERKRRGLGRPSLIYVKDFSSGLPKAQVQNCPNSNSGAAESATLEQPKPQANKTDKNKTEMNKPDPIHLGNIREQLEDYFYQVLEVDLLLRLCPDDEDTIYQIVDLLVDTCSTKRKMLRMPSLGMLTINALAAADAALIPVQAQYLSAKGLEQLLQTVQKVRRQINPKLKIEGILLTMTDSRTNYGKQISNLIRQAYGKHLNVFEQTIPRSVRAAETSAAGKSIFAYDSKGKVAEAYKSLAKEVLVDADRQRKLSSERAR